MAGSCTRYQPAFVLANTGKRAHVVSANIGPRFSRTADVLGYGRPRRAPNFRARVSVRVCVCVSRRSRSRDLPLEGEVTRSI